MHLLRVIFFLLACSSFGNAAIALNSSTAEWYAITYIGAAQTDFVSDSRTGIDEADLVGSVVGASPLQTAFYYRYDSVSDQVGFRLRVASDSNPPGYTGALWVGFMFDAGDSIDLFTGYINKNSTNTLGFYDPGAGANTSPSTTTVVDNTPLYSEVVTASNFLWTPVTVGPTGNDPVTGGINDIGSYGGVDYFATWVLSFNSLRAAALTQGFTITSSSAFRFVVGTSEQPNSMNQDLNGVSGGTTSTSTFATLGAVSPTVTSLGGVIPEPSSSLLAMLGMMALLARRRRLGN